MDCDPGEPRLLTARAPELAAVSYQRLECRRCVGAVPMGSARSEVAGGVALDQSVARPHHESSVVTGMEEAHRPRRVGSSASPRSGP